MSVYPKQTTVQGSIFNPSLWIYDDVLGITTDFLNANYVKYPVAQSNCDFNGIENAGEQVINGILETYGDVIFNKTAVGSLVSLATQPLPNDNSTKIPTTAWVQTAIGGGGVAEPLSDVLLSGNSAGTTSINMNNNDITNIKDLDVDGAADFNSTVNIDGVLTTTNAINMTGGSTSLNNISTRQVSLKDAAFGTSNGTAIFTNGNILTFDSRGPTATNSSMDFFVKNSSNAVINPLQLTTGGNNMNVPLDMINTGSFLNSIIRSRYFGLRDLDSSAITSCGIYYAFDNLQITSKSGFGATPTTMSLGTTDIDGLLVNGLKIYNDYLETDCPDPSLSESNSKLATLSWVKNVLTSSSYLSPSTIRRASSADIFTSGGNQIFNINIPLSGGSFLVPPPTNGWLQNQGVTFRVNYFQSFNPRPSGTPFDSQNYISFASTLTLYPFRFNTVGWLSTGGGGTPSQPRGRVSDNVITGGSGDNTNYVVLDTFSPSGRQFWASDISFQSNGAFNGRLFIYGGATINDVVFLLSKPNGFQNANQNYTYNFSVELLNQSNTFSTITSTGFNISNL
jgi:hypothetical protein